MRFVIRRVILMHLMIAVSGLLFAADEPLKLLDFVDMPTNRVVLGVEFGAPCPKRPVVKIRDGHPMFGIFKEYSIPNADYADKISMVEFRGVLHREEDAKGAALKDVDPVLAWIEASCGVRLKMSGSGYWLGSVWYGEKTPKPVIDIDLKLNWDSTLRLTIRDRDWMRVEHHEQLLRSLNDQKPDDYCELHSPPESLLYHSFRPRHVDEWRLMNLETSMTTNSLVKLTKAHLREYMVLLRDLNDFHRHGLRMSEAERSAIEDAKAKVSVVSARQTELERQLAKKISRWDETVLKALPQGSKWQAAYAEQRKKAQSENTAIDKLDLTVMHRLIIVDMMSEELGDLNLSENEAREFNDFVAACQEYGRLGYEHAELLKPEREYNDRQKALVDSLALRLKRFADIIKEDGNKPKSPRFIPPLDPTREKDVGIWNILGLSLPKLSHENLAFTNQSGFAEIRLRYSGQRLVTVQLSREYPEGNSIDDARKEGESLRTQVEQNLGVSFVEANTVWRPIGVKSCECSYSSLRALDRYRYSMCVSKVERDGYPCWMLYASIDDDYCRRLADKSTYRYPELTRINFGGFQLGEKYSGDSSLLGRGGSESYYSVTNDVPFCGFDKCVAEIDKATTNVYEVTYAKTGLTEKEADGLEVEVEKIRDRLEDEYGVLFSSRNNLRRNLYNGMSSVSERFGRFVFSIVYGTSLIGSPYNGYSISVTIRDEDAYSRWYESRFKDRESEWNKARLRREREESRKADMSRSLRERPKGSSNLHKPNMANLSEEKRQEEKLIAIEGIPCKVFEVNDYRKVIGNFQGPEDSAYTRVDRDTVQMALAEIGSPTNAAFIGLDFGSREMAEAEGSFEAVRQTDSKGRRYGMVSTRLDGDRLFGVFDRGWFSSSLKTHRLYEMNFNKKYSSEEFSSGIVRDIGVIMATLQSRWPDRLVYKVLSPVALSDHNAQVVNCTDSYGGGCKIMLSDRVEMVLYACSRVYDHGTGQNTLYLRFRDPLLYKFAQYEGFSQETAEELSARAKSARTKENISEALKILSGRKGLQDSYTALTNSAAQLSLGNLPEVELGTFNCDQRPLNRRLIRHNGDMSSLRREKLKSGRPARLAIGGKFPLSSRGEARPSSIRDYYEFDDEKLQIIPSKAGFIVPDVPSSIVYDGRFAPTNITTKWNTACATRTPLSYRVTGVTFTDVVDAAMTNELEAKALVEDVFACLDAQSFGPFNEHMVDSSASTNCVFASRRKSKDLHAVVSVETLARDVSTNIVLRVSILSPEWIKQAALERGVISNVISSVSVYRPTAEEIDREVIAIDVRKKNRSRLTRRVGQDRR